MKHILGLCSLLLMLQTFSHGAQRQVRVTAGQATVYDAPRSGAVVLGQLPRGTLLRSTGRTQGDWLAVEAPPEISGWIFGELLRGNIVEASTVRVRSGPGVGYEGLGSLVKGDEIVRRGSKGDWVELAGSAKMRVWVERSMVSAPAAVDLTASAPRPSAPTVTASDDRSEPSSRSQSNVPTRAPAPKPPPKPVVTSPPPVDPKPAPKVAITQPEPKSTAKPSSLPRAPVAPKPPVSMPVRRPQSAPIVRRPVAPEPVEIPSALPDRNSQLSQEDAQAVLPSGFRLVASAPQGRRVQMSGMIRPVGFGFFRPSQYRVLSGAQTFPRSTTAYIVSDQINLLLHVNKSITFTGRQFWLLGVREPVIVVDGLRQG